MKIGVKGFITCKGGEMYSDCADSYAFNTHLHKFAISDGVSKSFFPKIWSTILVNRFIGGDSSDEMAFIDACQNEWQAQLEQVVNKPEAKWYTRAAYNRHSPALATFVGLELLEGPKLWIASALGDSFLFFMPKGYTDFADELIKLSSKPEPVEFDNFPDYLASIGSQHKGLPQHRVKGVPLRAGTFYLMTDALAEWFLREGEMAAEVINSWECQPDFENAIGQMRQQRSLSDDDSAILVISMQDDGEPAISYGQPGVTILSTLVSEQELRLQQEMDARVEAEKAIYSQKVEDGIVAATTEPTHLNQTQARTPEQQESSAEPDTGELSPSPSANGDGLVGEGQPVAPVPPQPPIGTEQPKPLSRANTKEPTLNKIEYISNKF